jgi:hypothetical protein
VALRSAVVSISVDQPRRYSLDEYHQLIEAGAFDDSMRAELIDGWLVDMSPSVQLSALTCSGSSISGRSCGSASGVPATTESGTTPAHASSS